MIFVELFLFFIVYSFSGWFYESLLCSITQKKPVNRGFLNGPLCPVYGFGALTCIFLMYQKIDNPVLLFVYGAFLSCMVEYITAVLLERLFNARWWDYSRRRFNIHGRVFLLGAVVFGLFAMILIKYIHPLIQSMIFNASAAMQINISAIIFIVFLADIYITVQHLLTLNGRLQEIQAAINNFLEQPAKRAEGLKSSLMDKFEESEFYSLRIKTLLRLNRFQNTRIMRAFPGLRSTRYLDAWQKLKSALVGSDSNE